MPEAVYVNVYEAATAIIAQDISKLKGKCACRSPPCPRPNSALASSKLPPASAALLSHGQAIASASGCSAHVEAAARPTLDDTALARTVHQLQTQPEALTAKQRLALDAQCKRGAAAPALTLTHGRSGLASQLSAPAKSRTACIESTASRPARSTQRAPAMHKVALLQGQAGSATRSAHRNKQVQSRASVGSMHVPTSEKQRTGSVPPASTQAGGKARGTSVTPGTGASQSSRRAAWTAKHLHTCQVHRNTAPAAHVTDVPEDACRPEMDFALEPDAFGPLDQPSPHVQPSQGASTSAAAAAAVQRETADQLRDLPQHTSDAGARHPATRPAIPGAAEQRLLGAMEHLTEVCHFGTIWAVYLRPLVRGMGIQQKLRSSTQVLLSTWHVTMNCWRLRHSRQCCRRSCCIMALS